MPAPRACPKIVGLVLSLLMVACGSSLERPSSLVYPGSPFQLIVGRAMSPAAPVVRGQQVTFSVAPPLPPGLALDGSSGVLSGAPAVAQTALTYRVTAHNSEGSVTAEISITVIDEVSAPSQLAYQGGPFTLHAGVGITPLMPVVSGLVEQYQASPLLPIGLRLDEETGVISGAPAAAQEAVSYVITASNSAGSTNTLIQISIKGAPANLSYAASPAAWWAGVAHQISPTVTGEATAWSVAPALPAGIAIDPATGVIHGTSTAAQAAADYTVTAANPAGATTATVSIAVNGAPAGLGYEGAPFAWWTGSTHTVNPTVTGEVQTWTVAPALPAGLVLQTTGVITGTPTVPQVASSYVVTASNPAGATATTVSIAIKGPPSELSYPASPLVLTTGVPVSVSPQVTGEVTQWAIDSQLPTGMVFHTDTGVIDGTPTAETEQPGPVMITVTASNPAGSVQTMIALTVHGAVSIVEVDDTYWLVELDLTDLVHHSHHDIGRLYGETIKRKIPNFEALLTSYIEEARHDLDPMPEITYAQLIGRVNDIMQKVPQDYRDEIEGFASTLAGDANLDALHKAYVVNLLPDVMRPTACSALGVFGAKSVGGVSRMIRLLDWPGGKEHQVNRVHAVVHFKQGESSFYSIGILGFLGLISGVNKAGTFAGILDAMSIINAPYESAGKGSYVFDLRAALETQSTAQEVADYMVGNRNGANTYAFNHLIWTSDTTETLVVENNISYPFRAIRRDISETYNETTMWTHVAGVVPAINCFMLKDQPGDFPNFFQNCFWPWNAGRRMNLKDGYDDMQGAPLDGDDLKRIMTYHAGALPGDITSGDIYNTLTQQIIVYEPTAAASKPVEIFFAPRHGQLPATPLYQNVTLDFTND